MKTDNSNIVGDLSELAHQQYIKAGYKPYEDGNFSLYYFGAELGANWQIQQYKPILEYHAEVLDALKDAHKLLLSINSVPWWVDHKEECAQIYNTIQKANNLIQ